MKYSIVIPTYNKLEECLRPCVDSILRYTTLNDFSTELIIVANGCVDGTEAYIADLQSKFHNIRLLWFDEAIGFTKATNAGIKAANGDFIILFNNDNILLDQPYNQWLEILNEPFGQDASVGITGPMKEHCPHADRDFILFFCAMISRKVFGSVGYLDEVFSPGYGEDTDFAARLEDAGFKVVQVPDESRMFYDTNRRTGTFPLYHAGNKTFANWPGGEQLLAKNNKILEDKYKKVNLQEKDKQDRIYKAKHCDGYMSEEELYWLALQAAKSKIVIEVGSWHGRSSRALADNLPEGGRLYCVDHWDGSAVERDTNHASARLNEGDHAFLEFCDNLSEYIQSGKVIPVRMSSKNAAAWFKKQDIKADLIFLDAGHTYEEVKEDIKLWLPMINRNSGVFSGHDYNYTDGMWAGVTRAVDETWPNIENKQADETNIWNLNFSNESTRNYEAVDRGYASVRASKPNVYDCFPFFNELDVLDIRFAEMYDKVDRFIITEATLTHGGKPKPLYFKDNLARYEKYLSKVTHIIVDQYPALDSWSIERHQRDQLLRGLRGCKDSDIVIISDCDEIPKSTVIEKYKSGVMALEQNLYYYRLDCESTQKWDWAKICTYRDVQDKTPCGVRYTQNTDRSTIISDGGWHFSYLGDIKNIINKLEATAHQEYNRDDIKDPARIERIVNEGLDLFGRPLQYHFVEIDSTYPKYVLDNLEYFKQKGYITNVVEVVN